jgi:hypothetical protein
MDPREIELVLRFCQGVDELVTQDPGASHLEVLDPWRFRMNELLLRKKWSDATDLGHLILMLRDGHDVDEFLKRYRRG